MANFINIRLYIVLFLQCRYKTFLSTAVITVGLLQLVYDATEGPDSVATVCAYIEIALAPLSKDTIVNLVTPIIGANITGELLS